jgi:hypothetical protein
MNGQLSIKACGSFDCCCGCDAPSMKNEEKKKGTRQNPLKKGTGVDDCCDLDIDLIRLSLDVSAAAAADVADGAA